MKLAGENRFLEILDKRAHRLMQLCELAARDGTPRKPEEIIWPLVLHACSAYREAVEELRP